MIKKKRGDGLWHNGYTKKEFEELIEKIIKQNYTVLNALDKLDRQ